MAYYTSRINLASASFPFLTELWGQSIIVPQYDQNFDRQVVSAADQDRDKGIPQAFYMHNVMPTTNGYQSISYDIQIQPLGGGTSTSFDAVFPFQAINTGKYLWCPSAGQNFIYFAQLKAWYPISSLPLGTVPDNGQVTVAYLHGDTWFYYANYGCFKFNPATLTIDPVTLTGLTPANIIGIVTANGYMLAWTSTGIAWSSLVDNTDFTPSLATGAGGGQVNDAKGQIISCLPISGGFIVYCERNAVAAKYTGNTKSPFTYSEIPGSLGIRSPEQVSWQSNLSSHFAWTSSGLQELDKNGVRQTFADVSDFISAKIFEDYDETTAKLTRFPLLQNMNVKIAIVSSRYLVMSYGVLSGVYTHALTYDITLKRWGKLKITHRDCFEWNFPSLVGPLTYDSLAGQQYQTFISGTYATLGGVVNTVADVKGAIAFLLQDGTVKTAQFQFSETGSSGVLITGKYQFMRGSNIVHFSTQVESVSVLPGGFALTLIPFMDGKTPLPEVRCINRVVGTRTVDYVRKLTAQSYALVFKGAFNLNSVETAYTKGGSR